ncbi:MAG: proline dehydrogenase family protein [Candidatus Promineifilaceae bacterium]|nr:proline dehydrogenase family protein [Candidatus Promineifilaceae bacterium]
MENVPVRRRTLLIPSLLLILLTAGLLFWFAETWLRIILLYLSSATWARSFVSGMPVAKKVAGRFVAGERIEDAVNASRDLNHKDMLVTLDYLGESVTNIYEAIDARDEILRLLQVIHEEKLDANVSIKLSQIGLKLDEQLALDSARMIAERARQFGNKIRIDMEESEVVDATLDIYHALRYHYGLQNVGVVIQAYLYRSEEDVRSLIGEGAWVRLCKGAYMEPPEVAFPNKLDTDRNFIDLMKMLLSDEARQNGVYLGVATHDEEMIKATIDFTTAHHIDPAEFEFQMLFGIRRSMQQSLVSQGYKMRVYVPYGTAWYPYFVRRLAERPANLWFFISNLIRA